MDSRSIRIAKLRAQLEKDRPAHMRAEFEKYSRLTELANVSDSEKWENGVADPGILQFLTFIFGVLLVAWLAASPDTMTFFLSAIPFVIVFAAFSLGAYPHGTQKQRIDAGTALLVYLGVVVAWLISHQIIRDQQLLRAIDSFAIFGQLASFLASIKDSVHAWISPSQFRVLTPKGRQARKAQRQLNQFMYMPEDPSLLHT